MKNIKWKILFVTCAVCLMPVFLGMALWDKLPETIAIHFDFHGQPDNFASKGTAVFMLPLMLSLFQAFLCIINDKNSAKHGEVKKFETAVKWILPVLSVVLQIAIFLFSLGNNVDMRKVAVFIVGVIFLVTGNYMPKLDYVKNYKIDKVKVKKITRFLGFETVIMGIVMMISIFLPPVASAVCLVMLIPYTLISAVYAINVCRK